MDFFSIPGHFWPLLMFLFSLGFAPESPFFVFIFTRECACGLRTLNLCCNFFVAGAAGADVTTFDCS